MSLEKKQDQVALAVEVLAEAGPQLSAAPNWDTRRGAMDLDQLADAVRIVGLVGEHDHSLAEVVSGLSTISPSKVYYIFSPGRVGSP